MECLSPSLYVYNVNFLLNLERGGWGDSNLPLKACRMTPVKVIFSNLIIDELIPQATYLEYYNCLPKVVFNLVSFRKTQNLLLGISISSLSLQFKNAMLIC
jgi:hypothetical protein